MKNRMLKIACPPEMSRWIGPWFPFFGVIRSDGFLKHGAQSSREKLHSKILIAIVFALRMANLAGAADCIFLSALPVQNAALAEENELVFMGWRGADACFLRSQNAKK